MGAAIRRAMVELTLNPRIEPSPRTEVYLYPTRRLPLIMMSWRSIVMLIETSWMLLMNLPSVSNNSPKEPRIVYSGMKEFGISALLQDLDGHEDLLDRVDRAVADQEEELIRVG